MHQQSVEALQIVGRAPSVVDMRNAFLIRARSPTYDNAHGSRSRYGRIFHGRLIKPRRPVDDTSRYSRSFSIRARAIDR